MNFTRPMLSSTLLPKIQRKSMLPTRCRMPPCMNIELNSVRIVGGWSGAVPSTPGWPSHTICWPAIAHSLPGCVTS